MSVSVKGPASELEAEASRKLIKEKEISAVLSGNSSRQEIERVKVKLRELLTFYDRIINSVNSSINTIKSKTQLSQQEQKKYLINQAKELAQAKREKSKFRRYLQKINLALDELK
jgi:hypothetical protein